MKIKRYQARDMREALRRIREEQGPEAVILSSRKTAAGLEVVSAVDFDPSLIEMASVVGAGGGPSESGRDVLPDADESVDRSPVRGLMQRFGNRQGDQKSNRPRNPSGSGTEQSDSGDARVEDDRAVISRQARSVANKRDADSVGHEVDSARHGGEDQEMRNEINALRRMLESQLTALAWHNFARENPARGALARDLVNLGLGRQQSHKFAAEVSIKNDDLAHGWGRALGLIAQRIPVSESDPLEQGGIIAVVGPTGAGKTTTLAKLAARHAMLHGPETVVMISADDFRVGAKEQLFSWGRLLNVPVFSADSPEELCQRVGRFGRNQLVLVDTAGVGHSSQLLDRVTAMISGRGPGMRSLLVLPANAQRDALCAMLSDFEGVDLAGLAVTKVDEAVSLGGILGVLLDSEIPLAYTCDGQDVPENLRRASARNLVRRAGELSGPDHAFSNPVDLANELQEEKEYAFG
mgnify:CR=1 FL=1